MEKITLLSILQQSEYDLKVWRRWINDHQADQMKVAAPDWTWKLKLINTFSSLLFFLPHISAIELSTRLLVPFEQMIRLVIYQVVKLKLKYYRRRGLKVLAVAGSFAKTSTKHIIYHSLKNSLSTLVTPESYNTPLGIAQVIWRDLTPKHRLLIVEFGEYHASDIPELLNLVEPDYGILTPLGRQHLEVLGSFEAIVKTFQNFVQYFAAEDLLISEENRSYFGEDQQYFGSNPRSKIYLTNVKVSRAGTEFMVHAQQQKLDSEWFLPLLGRHQAKNSLAAIWLAEKLELDLAQIKKSFSTMPYITRRHQPILGENNVLILDNSYNTNPDSIDESLVLVNTLEHTCRLIVTLGFTELGRESDKIHYELGQKLAHRIDYVGLIKAPWSQKIIDGFIKAGGQESHIKVGTSQEEALSLIQAQIVPGSVVLFEGGYREVYV